MISLYRKFSMLLHPKGNNWTIKKRAERLPQKPVSPLIQLRHSPLDTYCLKILEKSYSSCFYWSIYSTHEEDGAFVFVLLFSSLSSWPHQRWKPVESTGTGRVDRPVGLPVGSRFFDRPVKPVETPVKFSFLATKKHLSTNRNIHIYFTINKTFHKKKVLTNHTFENTC